MPKFNLPYNQEVAADKKVLYKNARIIDPASGFDKMGELLTIGNKIADFAESLGAVSDAEVVERSARGLCAGQIRTDVSAHDLIQCEVRGARCAVLHQALVRLLPVTGSVSTIGEGGDGLSTSQLALKL